MLLSADFSKNIGKINTFSLSTKVKAQDKTPDRAKMPIMNILKLSRILATSALVTILIWQSCPIS
jgi:hypothetical protein